MANRYKNLWRIVIFCGESLLWRIINVANRYIFISNPTYSENLLLRSCLFFSESMYDIINLCAQSLIYDKHNYRWQTKTIHFKQEFKINVLAYSTFSCYLLLLFTSKKCIFDINSWKSICQQKSHSLHPKVSTASKVTWLSCGLPLQHC